MLKEGLSKIDTTFNPPQFSSDYTFNTSNPFLNIYDTRFPLQRMKFYKNHHKLEKWMSSWDLNFSYRENPPLCNSSLANPSPANQDIFKRYRMPTLQQNLWAVKSYLLVRNILIRETFKKLGNILNMQLAKISGIFAHI